MSVAIVAGALANKPHNGGEAWVRLSWVRGLERLGFETWFVEQIDRATCHADRVAWFEDVARRFGLAERASLLDRDGRGVTGAPRAAVEDAASRADLLVNISGNLVDERLLEGPSVTAYLDLDPGYTQFWQADGLLGNQLTRHDHLLTVGLATGDPACAVPVADLKWRAVAPPVVLADWPVAATSGPPRFTTVGSWRGGYGRVEQDGRLYGQKAHEFRRFSAVPREVRATFEAALSIDPADRADAERLVEGGWKLPDPREVARDPDAFREFVQGSTAEFSTAQGIYVESRSGWFSDRTTRYLASGKPAVVQDTGLPGELLPGEGLLTFRTVEEAVATARAVLDDHERHARAARRLAEERLDSDVVIGDLLEDLLP